MKINSAYLLMKSPFQTFQLFSEGQFDTCFKTTDFTHYQQVRSTTQTGDPPPISNLSQYYNTDYILWSCQYYGSTFYLNVETGQIEKLSNQGYTTSEKGLPVGFTASAMFLPVDRITGYTHLYLTGRVVINNGLSNGRNVNFVSVGAYAVVDGNLTGIESQFIYSSENSTISVDISSLPYIDYIVIRGCDGKVAVNEIYLENRTE